MRSVPENTIGTMAKGLAKLNYDVRYEHKEVRNGVVGEVQDLLEEDESINVNEGQEGSFQAQVGLPQQQSQGPLIHLERFLPLMSLKVLLVENDDSTRHVVSALLQNCSYEVTAVANGLQAWKILHDWTSHIDLVLTEMVTPSLSGIGLLGKIMNHKTYKNIPVIMMSSHNSMGTVFKCLSNGAVDFLLKPIRKNELKNLWQHVWKRCHSSSGSRSGSGIQTPKSAKSKCAKTGSNDEDYNGRIGLNVMDGSDGGSGTQGSRTKHSVEVDSPQPRSPSDQSADPPDATCALAIHPKPETFNIKWAPIAAKKQCKKQDKKLLENVAMSKDLEIGIPRNPGLQYEYVSQNVCADLMGTKREKLSELNPNKDNELSYKEFLELNNGKPSGELRVQAADHKGLHTNMTNPHVESRISKAPNGLSKMSEIIDKANSDAKELPSLELTLNRLRGIGDVGTATYDDCNVLKLSHLSAFSRYSTASTTNQAPMGNVGSCSLLNNSSEANKTESMFNQQSNESSTNNDKVSATKNVFNKPAPFNEKLASTLTARFLHPSTFQPMQNGHTCLPLQVMPLKADDAVVNAVVVQPRAVHQQVQVQWHHHHQLRKMQKQKPPSDHDDLSLNMAGNTLQCGSSNMFSRAIEGNAGNYSLNENGSSIDLNGGSMGIESRNGVTRKSGIEGGNGSGVDQNRFIQRVAALTKFRQKRKDRCFEKKVRYQSRKKLAEKRPRVRGQFVQQRVYGNTSREANS